MALEAQAMD
ncbi:hypothetical protein PENARI_c017G07695 [Penicillium arizonense]|uniref:Uncharacterized protein n=1 Tax=Penicillium arizonense TaxID=1835702 RepID=A0A1F5LAQ8_PENAI|nr:hypothetical protein PENARI_c017G07695 [Penicillium arizonense]